MTLLLTLTALGIAISLLYGWVLEYFIVKVFGLREDHDTHVSITVFLGVALLSSLLGIWSFFYRIDFFAQRVFPVIAICTLIFTWKYALARARIIFRQIASYNPFAWLAFAAIIVYGLYMAAAATPTYDTGLYHAQTIRWIETYPVVPGLANLHDRFGFNSNLFLLGAFWGFTEEERRPYQVPGLVIFFAFVLYTLYILEKYRKRPALSGLVALGILAYILMEQGMVIWLASPATDLSAAMLTWSCILLAMEKVEDDNLAQFNMSACAILCLALFAVTVKLSVAPMVSLPMLLIWVGKKDMTFKRFATAAFFSSLMVIPWLARNVVITGYLVYPFPALDLFNVDWKIPLETARITAKIVTAWGRYPYMNYKLALDMPITEWLPAWYQGLPRADFFLVNGLAVGTALFFPTLVFYKPFREQMRPYAVVYGSCLLSLAFCAVQSPSPRFGYGFLIPLFVLFLAPFVLMALSRIKLSPVVFAILVEVMLAVYTINMCRLYPRNTWTTYWNNFKKYEVPQTAPVQVDSILVFVPVATDQALAAIEYCPVAAEQCSLVVDQCWYDSFPCAPSIPQGLHMRGPNIEDGFYIKQK